MKNEQEIREEIEATGRTLKNYREAYKQSKIPFDVLEQKVNECHATIGALKWVLGENDRYD